MSGLTLPPKQVSLTHLSPRHTALRLPSRWPTSTLSSPCPPLSHSLHSCHRCLLIDVSKMMCCWSRRGSGCTCQPGCDPIAGLPLSPSACYSVTVLMSHSQPTPSSPIPGPARKPSPSLPQAPHCLGAVWILHPHVLFFLLLLMRFSLVLSLCS